MLDAKFWERYFKVIVIVSEIRLIYTYIVEKRQ